MTIKVVRGLVSTDKPTTPVQKNFKPNSLANQVAASQRTSSNRGVTDSAVTTFRSTKTLQTEEKIRDSKEARGVAKSVADRIFMEEKSAIGAHEGLSSGSARGIL